MTCADSEGAQAPPLPPPPHTHLENQTNIVFLSNTGLDSLKITKLPSQHSMLGSHTNPGTKRKVHKNTAKQRHTHEQQNANNVKQPAFPSSEIRLLNSKEHKNITIQGPNTKPQHTLGATINSIAPADRIVFWKLFLLPIITNNS